MKNPCYPAQVNQADFEAKVPEKMAKKFWDYAKAQTYFNHGYEALIDGLHTDFPTMPREWIVKTLDRNKTVRNATAQMKIAQMERDNIRARANIEARYIDSPRLTQTAMLLNDAYRGLYTLYHGPVFPWTHAQSLAEMIVVDVPKAAIQLAKGMPLNEVAGRSFHFAKMTTQAWKNFLSPAEYVKTVNWMESHPRYTEWTDAGADIKMGRAPSGVLGGKEITSSMRAWEGMKPTRLQMMDAEMYDGDPRNPSQMTLKPKYVGETEAELKRVRQQIASTYNHLTGTLSPKEAKLVGGPMWFAPTLTSSKWHAVVGDLYKSIAAATKGFEKTSKIYNPKNLTPADRAKISTTTRTVGGLFASHATLLALNEGILRLQAQLGGPVQHVNYKDYNKGDWLSFKIWGKVIKPRGLIEPLQLMGRLAGVLSGEGAGFTTQPTSFSEQAGRYFEYKLAPGASLGYELMQGKDIFSRPLPWGKNIIGKDVEETAFAPRYTYPEYVLSHGPIFFNEGVREFYAGLRDNGINASDAMSIAKGVVAHPKIVRDAAIQSAAGFIGLGVHPDYDAQQ